MSILDDLNKLKLNNTCIINKERLICESTGMLSISDEVFEVYLYQIGKDIKDYIDVPVCNRDKILTELGV